MDFKEYLNKDKKEEHLSEAYEHQQELRAFLKHINKVLNKLTARMQKQSKAEPDNIPKKFAAKALKRRIPFINTEFEAFLTQLKSLVDFSVKYTYRAGTFQLRNSPQVDSFGSLFKKYQNRNTRRGRINWNTVKSVKPITTFSIFLISSKLALNSILGRLLTSLI